VYETTVQKQNVMIHEDYSSDNPFENDIALIKVPKSYYKLFVYPYVDLVELPESDENFVGMTATVASIINLIFNHQLFLISIKILVWFWTN